MYALLLLWSASIKCWLRMSHTYQKAATGDKSITCIWPFWSPLLSCSFLLSASTILHFFCYQINLVAILTSLPPPFFIDCLSFYLAKKKQTQKYICTWINDSTVNWLEANHLHYYLSLLHKMYVEILKFMALGTWTSKKMKLNQFW